MSVLYKSILKEGLSNEDALRKWAVAHTPAFREYFRLEDDDEEPSLRVLNNYINDEPTENISQEGIFTIRRDGFGNFVSFENDEDGKFLEQLIEIIETARADKSFHQHLINLAKDKGINFLEVELSELALNYMLNGESLGAASGFKPLQVEDMIKDLREQYPDSEDISDQMIESVAEAFYSTDDEILSLLDQQSLDTMTDEEKRAYIDARKEVARTLPAKRAIENELKSVNKSLATVKAAIEKAAAEGNDTKLERLAKRQSQLMVTHNNLRVVRDMFRSAKNLVHVMRGYQYLLQHAKEQLARKDLSERELMAVRDTLTLIERVSKRDVRGKHPVYSEGQLKNPDNIAYADQIANEANAMLQAEVLNYQIKLFNESNDRNNLNLTDSDVRETTSDIDFMSRFLRSIDKVKDRVSQAIERLGSIARFNINEQFFESNLQLDKLFEGVSYNEEDFKQKNKDGLYTDRMISPFTYEWMKELEAKEQLAYDHSQSVKDKSINFRRYTAWLKKNAIVFNAFALDNAALMAKERRRFSKLSDKEFEAIVDEARKADNAFQRVKEALERERDNYISTLNNQSAIQAAREHYQNEIDMLSNNMDPRAFQLALDGRTFKLNRTGKPIPYTGNKKFIIPKNDSDFDSRFEKIRNNDKLLDIYNYINATTNRISKLAYGSERQQLQSNFLPVVASDILASATSISKTGVDMSSIGDKLLQVFGIPNDDLAAEVDPITGEIKYGVSKNFLTRSKNLIDKQKTLLEGEKQLELGRPLTNKEKQEIEIGILNDLASKRSWNIKELMRLFNLLTITYQNKIEAIDEMEHLASLAKRRQSYVKNRFGKDIVTNPDGSEATPLDSAKNISGAIDNFIETFKGVKGQVQLFTITKSKTKDARRAEALLDAGLSSDELNEISEEDRSVTAGSVLSSAVTYTQYIGMAYNVFSALSTALYGSLSNYIESGRYYSAESLSKALGISLKIGSKEGRKLKALVDRYGLLQDFMNEVRSSAREVSPLSKLAKRLGAFKLQEKSEYVAQAPIAGAYLLDEIIDTPKGKVTAFEAFNDDGTWNTEYGEYPREQMLNLFRRIKDTQERIHGNYDPEKRMEFKNKTFMGDAAMQFRTWMVEGFAARWEEEKYVDAQQGVIKGRWRSYKDYWDYVKKENGESTWMARYKYASSILSAMVGRFSSLIPGVKPSDNNKFKFEGLDEVDQVNMYSNASELLFFIGLMIAGYILRAGLDDENEKDKNSNVVYTLRFMINQFTRLQTDIALYISPNEFEKLNKNILPVLTTLGLILKFGGSVVDTMQGDAYVTSGIYANQLKIVRDGAKIIPFGRQIYRLQSQVSLLYDK